MDPGSLWHTWATIRTTCAPCAQLIVVSWSNGYTVQQKAPMESLLRSALLVLMDNTTAEYIFVTTFFSPVATLVPVPKETLMSPPIGQSSLAPMAPDDEAGTPPGALSVSTSMTVDTNSNPAPSHSVTRGATPQHNPPVQLSKEDQAALTSVWKQITDPAVEYTQVSTLTWPSLNLNLTFPVEFAPTAPLLLVRR
jgi:hypothetical protein